MAELYDTKETIEKLILVAVQTNENEDTSESLDELEELARTAGAEVIGRMVQNRESIHPGTYLGKGKIEELGQMVQAVHATGIVCDDELSPTQLKHLSMEIDTKIMDRTMLILDIFAQHASTKEGKIQVELAQLKYKSTRLIGMRNYSRLGGGIGTRGPGEKKLEEDRRLLRDRITLLNHELEVIKSNRDVARSQRQKSTTPVISIVGYTNAGKSTLMNILTGAGVLEEDKLFATLDPTTRNMTFESGQQVLFTDTVGFIRKLPHHLVDAFRSTLEEAKYADIIIHVVDASNPKAYQQMHVVYETLLLLEIKDKIIVTVFNKQDKQEAIQIKDLKADKTVKISAKTGEGINTLLEVLEEILQERKILIERVFPYAEAGKLQTIRKYGQLIEEEYRDEGIYVKAYIPKELNL